MQKTKKTLHRKSLPLLSDQIGTTPPFPLSLFHFHSRREINIFVGVSNLFNFFSCTSYHLKAFIFSFFCLIYICIRVRDLHVFLDRIRAVIWLFPKIYWGFWDGSLMKGENFGSRIFGWRRRRFWESKSIWKLERGRYLVDFCFQFYLHWTSACFDSLSTGDDCGWFISLDIHVYDSCWVFSEIERKKHLETTHIG